MANRSTYGHSGKAKKVRGKAGKDYKVSPSTKFGRAKKQAAMDAGKIPAPGTTDRMGREYTDKTYRDLDDERSARLGPSQYAGKVDFDPKRGKSYKADPRTGDMKVMAQRKDYGWADDLDPTHTDRMRKQGRYQERNPQYSGGRRLEKGENLGRNREQFEPSFSYNEGRGTARDDMGDMAPKAKPKMKQVRKYTNNSYMEGE